MSEFYILSMVCYLAWQRMLYFQESWLIVCLFVCKQHFSKRYKRTALTLYEGLRVVNEQVIQFWQQSVCLYVRKWTKYTILVIACPDTEVQAIIKKLWG